LTRLMFYFTNNASKSPFPPFPKGESILPFS
jgi:hypothetical protein